MTMRVAVLGGGAIGLATACELARHCAAVTVLDAAGSRRPTTLTSFARLNASEKRLPVYFELNEAGMAAYRAHAAEHGMPAWLRLTGHLEWAGDDESRDALVRRAELCAERGYSVRLLSGREAKALEPELRVPDGEEVVFFPDEGYVETAGLLGELARRAVALGVELRREAPVAGFAVAGGRLTGVELEDGETLAADAVVLAAGRWSAELARLAGAELALLEPEDEGVSGFLAWTAPTTASLSRSVFAPRLNVRPDGGGRLLLQAFELDAGAERDVAEAFAERLRETLACPPPVEIEAVRVGVRALPADGLPLVGWTDGVEGLYAVVTHSGITLALLLGRLAAAEVAAGTSRPLLEPFRPGRASLAPQALRSPV